MSRTTIQIVLFLINAPLLVLVGYTFARCRETWRLVRELQAGVRRASVILLRAREHGWIDLSEFRELVSIWPGYADLAFLVRAAPKTTTRMERPN
jgi:hypothetical protein